MKDQEETKNTIDDWESGALGEEKKYARPMEKKYSLEIDEAAELQMISIRLDKSLIEELKLIASLGQIGYQPLIRRVLHRFTNAELKKLAWEYAELKIDKNPQETSDDHPSKQAAC